MGERSELSAVLLAGGAGSRIRELFPDIPKPMIPVAGLPAVEWIVRLWAKQGVQRFVLSTGYLGDLIERHFSSPALENLEITCLREPAPLGTGGALTFVAKQVSLSDPFLVGNADSLSALDIQGALRHLADTSAGGLVFTAHREDASQSGRISADARSQIHSFEEKTPGPGLVNAGVYLLRLNTLVQFPETVPLSIEREVFPQLLAAGSVFVSYPIADDFLDIGTPAGYAAADAFVRLHLESHCR
jgi:NDP-sugar pyrophosphorylase family protein